MRCGVAGDICCLENKETITATINNNNILYSSQREIKAFVRSHNEEHISIILNHETHAHTHKSYYISRAISYAYSRLTVGYFEGRVDLITSGSKDRAKTQGFSLLWLPSSALIQECDVELPETSVV